MLFFSQISFIFLTFTWHDLDVIEFMVLSEKIGYYIENSEENY